MGLYAKTSGRQRRLRGRHGRRCRPLAFAETRPNELQYRGDSGGAEAERLLQPASAPTAHGPLPSTRRARIPPQPSGLRLNRGRSSEGTESANPTTMPDSSGMRLCGPGRSLETVRDSRAHHTEIHRTPMTKSRPPQRLRRALCPHALQRQQWLRRCPRPPRQDRC